MNFTFKRLAAPSAFWRLIAGPGVGPTQAPGGIGGNDLRFPAVESVGIIPVVGLAVFGGAAGRRCICGRYARDRHSELPTRDFVPFTLQSRWHSLTRNWPVFALRDCSVAAKSTRPPRMGDPNAGCRAGGAYTPQRSKLPLSSTSLFEQPLERDSRTGGRRVNSLPAFARRQQNIGFGRGHLTATRLPFPFVNPTQQGTIDRTARSEPSHAAYP